MSIMLCKVHIEAIRAFMCSSNDFFLLNNECESYARVEAVSKGSMLLMDPLTLYHVHEDEDACNTTIEIGCLWL